MASTGVAFVLSMAVLIGQLTAAYAQPAGSSAANAGTGVSTDGLEGGPTVRTGSAGLKSYTWGFGRSNDTNFDGWPDGWQRRRGRRYPAYVDIGIIAHDAAIEGQLRGLDTAVVRNWPSVRHRLPSLPVLPPSITDLVVDRYLRVSLDGGLAMAQSRPVAASRRYQYQFSCRLMTDGLRHDSARAELVFLDAQQRELSSHATRPVTGTSGWISQTIERIHPPADATLMQVRLRVSGSEDGLEDIRGSIGIDDIVVRQFPQLQVTTDRANGVYRVGQPITAMAKAMGLTMDRAHIRLRLLDHDGAEVATVLRAVHPDEEIVADEIGGPPNSQAPRRAPDQDSANPPDQAKTEPLTSLSFGRRVQWQLPPIEPGFYRVTAELENRSGKSLATQTTLAVVDPRLAGPPGSFGWTLPPELSGTSRQPQQQSGDWNSPIGMQPPQDPIQPRGLDETGGLGETRRLDGSRGLDEPRGEIQPRALAAWLVSLGVSWVKIPCWFAPDDQASAERAADLVSKLQDAGIQTVGVLDVPPEDQLLLYELRTRRDAVAAQLFRDQAVWQPQLEPVMSRLGLKVRLWQLGGDDDFSFLGRPRLRDTIEEISRGLQGFGQPVEIAISWPWLEPQSSLAETSWQAVCRSSRPPLTADELEASLTEDTIGSQANGLKRWVLLDPLAKHQYRRDDRIRDLVRRMATVRGHRVQAAFVSRPADPQYGLLTQDGRPDEMLLPWRTTAQLIGNLRNIGSVELRSGAHNAAFVGDGRTIMMLWSPEPTEELIYLGDSVQHIDVWGKQSTLANEVVKGRVVQRVPIGPLPSFLVGLDPDLLALRMSVELGQRQIDSLLGQKQQVSVLYTNPTEKTIAGEIQLHVPDNWKLEERARSLELSGGGEQTENFDVVLSNSATIGDYEIPIDLEVLSTPPKQITVYRKLRVGPDGLDVHVTTRLVNGSELRVRVEITNKSDDAQSYDCLLFPGEGRQYQRRFVTIRPRETVERSFAWPDAAELVGKPILLRAVEHDGRRVLNYEVVARR